MRTLPAQLAADFAAGATCLARCWRLTRRDGTVLGFTDHDRDLVFDGVVHAAATGLSASESEAQIGFAPGGGEVAGAISAPTLTEDDLLAGRWDASSVEAWWVDWRDPSVRVPLAGGVLGEVKRAGSAFTAEVRGPAAALDAESGSVFQATCRADLGDAACRVDLSAPLLRAEGVVSATDGAAYLASADLAGRQDGLFTGGRLAMLSGAAAGLAVEVRRHGAAAAEGRLELWQPLVPAAAPGDRFVVTAGCDKSFDTCRTRFANSINFRGFPHMPGTDFVVRAIQQGEAGMDGGSLFR